MLQGGGSAVRTIATRGCNGRGPASAKARFEHVRVVTAQDVAKDRYCMEENTLPLAAAATCLLAQRPRAAAIAAAAAAGGNGNYWGRLRASV
jgi:hypothetical protein